MVAKFISKAGVKKFFFRFLEPFRPRLGFKVSKKSLYYMIQKLFSKIQYEHPFDAYFEFVEKISGKGLNKKVIEK
jgi:hypothetical protein